MLVLPALLPLALLLAGARVGPPAGSPGSALPPETPEISPAQLPESIVVQINFDPATVDPDRLAALFLPEGADEWQPLVPEVVGPGEVRIIQQGPGTVVLVELPLLRQPLRDGFTTVVFPGVRTRPAEQLAGLFPSGFVGA